MIYLLDTNICIYVINRKPAGVVRRMQRHQAGTVGISAITMAELEYGASRSRYPDRNRLALLEFLFPFAFLDFDQQAATCCGRIRHDLELRGLPIGPMDLLLAAQARSRDLILVTNNESEFKRIEGLRVENWTEVG